MSSTPIPRPPCGGEPCAEMARHLVTALDSRDTIGMAKGLLMAADEGVDPDAAFALLRQASQRRNQKLTEVARAIVERRTASAAQASDRSDLLQVARATAARARATCDTS